MSKKHFDMMAEEIRKHVERLESDIATHGPSRVNDRIRLDQAWYAATVFINVAEQFNPKFDRHRFLVACGLSD